MSVPNVGKTHYRTGGTRGGADRFDWNDVKSDTYRENYIGHSLKAPIGRWYANGKDHLWWTKKKETSGSDSDSDSEEDEARRKHGKKRRRRKKKKRRKDRDLERNEKDDEIKQLKKLEEDMMAQALGLKPKDEDPGRVKQLDANEMKELLKKGNNGQSEEDGRRIRGLGSGFSKRHEFVPSELRKRGNAATFSLETSVTDSLDSESKNRRREPDLEAEKKGKKQRKKSKHKAKKSRKSERYDSSD